MNRRDFLSLLAVCGVQGAWRGRIALGAPAPASALWVHVQATGGWDQALFCDPKPGLRPGLPAAQKAVRRAGNLSYLAFADFGLPEGQGFFGRYYDRLLVLNGVDTGTNNHDVGTRYSSSGSTNERYPCFAAQVAAVYGQAQPLPLLAYGGYDETADLVSPARLQIGGTQVLGSLAQPNDAGGGEQFLPASTASLVEQAHRLRTQRLLKDNKLPGQQQALGRLLQVRAAQQDLSRLQVPTGSDDLYKLVRIALDAYQLRLAVSMTLSVAGFDSHSTNEATQGARLKELFATVSYIVDESERRKLPVVVLMTSDFGRSPHYTNDGTDHWPTSSIMILQNAPAKVLGQRLPTNQVIGATTDGGVAQALRPLRVNPRTLQADSGGLVMTPGHLVRALRRAAMIDGADALRRFPLTVDQDLALG